MILATLLCTTTAINVIPGESGEHEIYILDATLHDMFYVLDFKIGGGTIFCLGAISYSGGVGGTLNPIYVNVHDTILYSI